MSQENLDLGDQIIGYRLCQSTKKQYERKVHQFKQWLVNNYPEKVLNNDILLDSITNDNLKEFFGYICLKRKRDGSSLPQNKYQSFQHVSGYKSAIKDLYHSKRSKISDDFEDLMKDFFQGYQRKIAELKQNGEMSTVEGKQPCSFSGYRFLAGLAMSQSADIELGIFAHLFLLFSWNLISRCASISNLMFDHIFWDEDSMVIIFPSHKGDKEGKNSAPKHLYANPKFPLICPVLSLAIFVFTIGIRRSDSKKLIFAGENEEVESRFSKWLKKNCEKNEEQLLTLGLLIDDIGTHSFRKGIATFLSSMPGGPSAISIYLRAGWSLGAVQSRYILEGQGGDQLCGRAATGLSLTDNEFSTLPPHFDPLHPPLNSNEWEQILPGYSKYYPTTFKQVIPYLLASLITHRNFLISTLPCNHPLFLQRIWTSKILDQLADQVLMGNNRHPVSRMTATGIPPHILLSNEIMKVKGEVHASRIEIIEKIENLPTNLKNTLLENFQLNGIVPITLTQVQSMVDSMKNDLISVFHTGIQQERNQAQNSSSKPKEVFFKTWVWGERFQIVPEGFRFPSCNVRNLWDLWWSGNKEANVPPYRMISTHNLTVKSDHVLLSKAKFVVSNLIKHGPSEKRDSINTMNISERDSFLEHAHSDMSRKMFPSQSAADMDRRRIGDIKFITLYDLIKKHSPEKLTVHDKQTLV